MYMYMYIQCTCVYDISVDTHYIHVHVHVYYTGPVYMYIVYCMLCMYIVCVCDMLQIFMWNFKDNKDLVGVAFIDTDVYSLRAVSLKNFIVVCDIHHSIQLLKYKVILVSIHVEFAPLLKFRKKMLKFLYALTEAKDMCHKALFRPSPKLAVCSINKV